VRRRDFIRALAGSASLWPLVARAQRPPAPVVGLLSSASATAYVPFVNAIREGLKQSGYVEGQNLTIEYRWADGAYDRAADLVRRQVSLIITSGGVQAAVAAKRATSTIPIVFHIGDDPVRVGIVESLNRPGGNVTGVTFLTVVTEAKRLALLSELVPKARVIGLLVNPANPGTGPTTNEVQSAAKVLGLQVHAVSANTEEGIDAAFQSLAQQRVGALLAAPDTIFRVHMRQILSLVTRYSLPTMYATRDFVEAGGLISYGSNITDAYREEGVYAGMILKGAKPADLPVMQSSKFELVINRKAAKELALAVPDKIVALADQVID
jgi:putative ABC transport system substrate-binding protein